MIVYWISKGLGNRGPNNPGPGSEPNWEAFHEEDEYNANEEDDECEDIEINGDSNFNNSNNNINDSNNNNS